MRPEKTHQEAGPTPLWMPLAVIFIFVSIMLGATIVCGYLLF